MQLVRVLICIGGKRHADERDHRVLEREEEVAQARLHPLREFFKLILDIYLFRFFAFSIFWQHNLIFNKFKLIFKKIKLEYNIIILTIIKFKKFELFKFLKNLILKF